MEPYSYTRAGSGATSQQMSQAGDAPAFLAGGIAGVGAAGAAAMSHSSASAPSQYAPTSSDGHYPDYAAYANGAHSSSSGGVGAGGATPVFRQPSPGPSLAMTNSSSGFGAGMVPGAKEREAMGRGNFAVSNADEGEGSGARGPVMQHRDAGRLNATAEVEEPAEIPPSYDSIPRDQTNT